MEKKQSHTIEFISLLTQHQVSLRGYIISLVPGSDDVGDILQETNIVLWKKKKSFKQGTNFKAWAFAVARNKVKQYKSKLYRAGEIDKLVFENEEQFMNAVVEAQYLSGDDDKELHALELCIEKLSEQQRQLIKLRYSSSSGLAQHAESLGTTVAYLRVSLSRIRAKLKTCIEKRISLEGATQ